MNRVVSCLGLFLVGLSLTGCFSFSPARSYEKTGWPPSFIYYHTIRPLDLNLEAPPVVPNSEEGDIRHLHYYVDVRWDSNAIGEIAREEGIETVYYADLEVLSVLGIWNQYIVHIYGK